MGSLCGKPAGVAEGEGLAMVGGDDERALVEQVPLLERRHQVAEQPIRVAQLQQMALMGIESVLAVEAPYLAGLRHDGDPLAVEPAGGQEAQGPVRQRRMEIVQPRPRRAGRARRARPGGRRGTARGATAGRRGAGRARRRRASPGGGTAAWRWSQALPSARDSTGRRRRARRGDAAATGSAAGCP